MSEYSPGTYVKGDVVRVANSVSEAVALRFEGYKFQDESASSAEAPTEPVAPEQPEAVAPGKALVATPRPPRQKD